jgi:predicted RNA-binding protein Jag
MTVLAEAELIAAGKQAEAKKMLADGARAEKAAPGLADALVKEATAAAIEKVGVAEARVIEAKADANYKQGNADARVLAERLEAEAGGVAKLGQAKADTTKAMGDAEADAIGRKMAAESEGLTSKFEAMGKMSQEAREHEEFRMQLEAALKQALASLDAGKEVSRENAEVLATALQNANIELIGGDGGVFDALTKGVSIGKALDGITGQSQVLQQLLGKLTGIGPARLTAPDDAEA